MKTERDIIRSALIRAIKWEQGLLDAHAHIADTGSVRTDIKKRIAAYTGLLEKKYGGLPAEPDWTPVSILDVK